MDFIRRPYRGKMAFWRDDPERLVDVVWTYAADGADVIPFAHQFGACVWDDQRDPPKVVGEVSRRTRDEWIPRSTLVGGGPCGAQEVWEQGATESTPLLDVDGEGVPLCCRPPKHVVGFRLGFVFQPPAVDLFFGGGLIVPDDGGGGLELGGGGESAELVGGGGLELGGRGVFLGDDDQGGGGLELGGSGESAELVGGGGLELGGGGESADLVGGGGLELGGRGVFLGDDDQAAAELELGGEAATTELHAAAELELGGEAATTELHAAAELELGGEAATTELHAAAELELGGVGRWVIPLERVGWNWVAAEQGTTSTTEVDLGSADSVTVDVESGDTLFVIYKSLAACTTAAQSVYSAMRVDGGTLVGLAVTACPLAFNPVQSDIMVRITGLSAGAHTIAVKHYTTGGTGYWSLRSLLAVRG